MLGSVHDVIRMNRYPARMKRRAGVKIRMIPCLARCYRMAAHRSGPVCGGQDVTVDENSLAAVHELYLR